MKRFFTLLTALGLMLALAVSVQAQGYTVNHNWLNGNNNNVTNVNQQTVADKNNLHIYKQRPGQPAPAVVNQTKINGHGNQVVNHNQNIVHHGPSIVNQTQINGHANKVVNHNQTIVHHGPVFGRRPQPDQQLVNLQQMQYPKGTTTPHTVTGNNGVTNVNHVTGNNNAILNAVQQSLANGATIPGQPIINVNININTIIGNNNSIINQMQP